MKNGLQLSNKSEDFIENLRVYLFTSGKNPDEIEDIVNQLEIHLFEAEKRGKPIEKIIGKSPKEYMEMVSNEMVVDHRTWIKYICIIVFGSFSVTILPDLIEGNLAYSILEIIGHIVIGTIFIASLIAGFKYISVANYSLKKQGLIIGTVAAIPLILFFGLTFLNEMIETPIIFFGDMGSIAIGIIAALIIIGISIWAKTWILMIMIGFLTIPNLVLNFTPLQDETQLLIGSIVTFGGLAIYILILSKLEKNN